MRASKDLVGNPIVSMTNGRSIATVSDVYLDRELNRIVALLTGYEGLLKRKAQVVLRERVTVLGEDVILTEATDVILPEDQVEAFNTWIRRDQLNGRNVDTPGGTRIARLDDVIVSDEGEVLGFSFGRTYIDSPVAESGAVSCQAVIDTGAEDGVMTIDLEKAERENFAYSM